MFSVLKGLLVCSSIMMGQTCLMQSGCESKTLGTQRVAHITGLQVSFTSRQSFDVEKAL